jgi:predicted DNA-binding protein
MKDKPFKDMYKRKYKMLQLPEETHQMLKEYCEHHGFTMSGFVSAIIKQTIKGKK